MHFQWGMRWSLKFVIIFMHENISRLLLLVNPCHNEPSEKKKEKIGQESSQHAPGIELMWCVMSRKPFFKHHKNHDDNREEIIALKTSSLSFTSLLNSKQLHDMMTNFIQLKIAQFFIAIAIRLWLISFLAALSQHRALNN